MVLCLALGCAGPDTYLIHPRTPPEGVTQHDETHQVSDLRLRMEWAIPEGQGPFATVLVHPAAGQTAAEMRGVAGDLAAQGYLAVAVDYQRRTASGGFEPTLFPWRSPADARAAIELVLDNPLVDASRVGALGFSQGGVFSLLIAAHDPRVRTVVAYYPVTDFSDWLTRRRRNPMRRLVFKVIRWYFRKQSGAATEEEFEEMLAEASPYCKAERIRCPVLLVHGEEDTSAPVEESLRMARRLEEAGCEAELLVVEGAPHVFNFKDAELGRQAWRATEEWLATHL